MRAAQEDARIARFGLNPAGPFVLRDYSGDDAGDLKALGGLLGEILAQHKALIPGSMNRLVAQWHADVRKGIEAENEQAGERGTERPAT
jgi:hypothetical protein